MKVGRLGRKLAPVAGSWALRLLGRHAAPAARGEGRGAALAAGAPVIYVVVALAAPAAPVSLPPPGTAGADQPLRRRRHDSRARAPLRLRHRPRIVEPRGSGGTAGSGPRRSNRVTASSSCRDGPRGPREVLKPGVVALARLTGAPVVPRPSAASSEWRARSWDGFRMPKPFSRCVVRFGDPIRVPRNGDAAGEETARKEIEAALNAVTSQVRRGGAALIHALYSVALRLGLLAYLPVFAVRKLRRGGYDRAIGQRLGRYGDGSAGGAALLDPRRVGRRGGDGGPAGRGHRPPLAGARRRHDHGDADGGADRGRPARRQGQPPVLPRRPARARPPRARMP